MDARTAWFRETGEARPKEQLLIETMFCVYYLSKGSAVLVTRVARLQPIFCLYSLCPRRLGWTPGSHEKRALKQEARFR
jgi:hypothetical protein